MAVTIQPLPLAEGWDGAIPERFTYPFCYEPHPLCIAAAAEVRSYLAQHPEWHTELQQGKMFGVLIVDPLQTSPSKGRLSNVLPPERGLSNVLPLEGELERVSFLAAFSGTLDGKTQHPYFVPPVFDLMAPGCYFQEEEQAISALNRRITQLSPAVEELERGSAQLREEMEAALAEMRKQMQRSKAERDAIRQSLSPTEKEAAERQLIRQSQHEKAEFLRLKRAWEQRIADAEAPLRERREEIEHLKHERHQRSIVLQNWLFRQFVFRNALGEERSLPELFSDASASARALPGHKQPAPPSGAGECCAPRLLQAAYVEGLRPICMAEFWVGDSPANEIRRDGHFYPACNSKCRPILRHMLRGLNVEPNPLHLNLPLTPEIIYQDSEMAVVNKPSGLLSVPGKDDQPSVLEAMRQMFPNATGPLIVHRLDMDTSGLMLIALTEAKYHELQTLFLRRAIHKVYHALLEREMPVGQEGDIELRMRPDYDDRPRQVVDPEHGKLAQTHYRVLGNRDGHALLELRPLTGRTHQLRVACAHPLGLDNPIVGDRLYGTPAERLMLHAKRIEIRPPSYSPGMEDQSQKVSPREDLEGATFESYEDIA